MLIGDIINDSFGLLSKQLKFYCWHFRRNLDQRQRLELIELLYEQNFERLASKIRSLNHNHMADYRQQVGKLLFEHCLTSNRRHQLIQLIESRLVDINVRLDNYGRTLLHRSAYNLDVELVKILIEQGVNIRLRDYAGNTALHIAIQSYRNGAVIYGSGPDVVLNLTAIIKLLLEADKNLQDERYRRKKIRSIISEESRKRKVEELTNDDHERVEDLNMLDELGSKQTYPYPYLGGKQDSSCSGHNFSTTSVSFLKGNPEKQKGYLIVDRREQEYNRDSVLTENSAKNLSPILLEDNTSPLIDTKNAFGRTALHYCVLVVGEQHLAHFVKLLISFGADTDATDTRMKTPLYCLVRRPNISAIRQKCLAITHLLESGCDDLGLTIEPRSYFNEKLMNHLEENISNILQSKVDDQVEPIFTHSTYKRVPHLKHLARVRLVRLQDEKTRLKRQTKLSLPKLTPASLNLYINKRILDQSELF